MSSCNYIDFHPLNINMQRSAIIRQIIRWQAWYAKQPMNGKIVKKNGDSRVKTYGPRLCVEALQRAGVEQL
jgi:hypothetical protein